MTPRLLRIALLLVEATSIPLLVLLLLYLLTGYQMLVPGFRVFENPRLLHTDRVLRVLTVALALLHSYGGLLLLISRRARKLALALIPLATGLVVFFAVLVVALELYVR